MPLTAIEQAIIDAALEFANLPQIESVDQVLMVLRPAVEATEAPIFQTIPESNLGAFRDDHAQLLEWLDAIGRRPPTKADREYIWANLRMVLGDTVASTARPMLDGVRWLGQCQFPNCRNWFFAWRSRGAPRKSCCPAHDSPQPVQ